MAAKTKIILDRRKVMARILRDRGDALLVTGLGAPTWDAAAVGDHANNFYLWGGMGGAVMTGLGLALAQPGRRVLVITGDGEMLMGLGGLATVAVQKPANLGICIIDNQRYGETGMQITHTAGATDQAAAASGIPVTGLVRAPKPRWTPPCRLSWRRPGPCFTLSMCAPKSWASCCRRKTACT